jgi:hypothetical protein
VLIELVAQTAAQQWLGTFQRQGPDRITAGGSWASNRRDCSSIIAIGTTITIESRNQFEYEISEIQGGHVDQVAGSDPLDAGRPISGKLKPKSEDFGLSGVNSRPVALRVPKPTAQRRNPNMKSINGHERNRSPALNFSTPFAKGGGGISW